MNMNIWYRQHPNIDPCDKPSPPKDFFDFIYELDEDEYFDILASEFTAEELEDREIFLTALQNVIKYPPKKLNTPLDIEINKILDMYYYKAVWNGKTYI